MRQTSPIYVTLLPPDARRFNPIMHIENQDGVYTLTMPDGGAFNPDSLRAFSEALDTVLADESAEVLLITGQEKNFSQGLDLEYIMAHPDEAMQFVGDCMRVVGRLLYFPLPVAAMVNGHAFGLGAMITLASDYKVMREDRGFFCLPEIDLGMTLTYRMNALVCGKLSGTVLRDVLQTGQRVTGSEAEQMGIVDRTAPVESLRALALELVQPMRGKDRRALSGLKRGINIDILATIEGDVPDATIEGV